MSVSFQQVLSQFFGDVSGLVELAVTNFPDPKSAARSKVTLNYTGDLKTSVGESMLSCDKKGPLMVNVTKMFPRSVGLVEAENLCGFLCDLECNVRFCGSLCGLAIVLAIVWSLCDRVRDFLIRMKFRASICNHCIWLTFHSSEQNQLTLFHPISSSQSSLSPLSLSLSISLLCMDRPDATSFDAFGRVMSGTLRVGDKVRVLGEAYSLDDKEDMTMQEVTDSILLRFLWFQ